MYTFVDDEEENKMSKTKSISIQVEWVGRGGEEGHVISDQFRTKSHLKPTGDLGRRTHISGVLFLFSHISIPDPSNTLGIGWY